MSNNRQIRVAITHGDTNGIGYELIFKTFSSPEMLELCTPIIYGSEKVADYHRKALETDINYTVLSKASEAKDGRINLLNVTNEEISVDFGTPSEEAGRVALTALDKAIVDFNDHQFDVLVTAPINTESLKIAGQEIKGQLNYVAECFAENNRAMNILVNDILRIGLITDNTLGRDTTYSITRETLSENVEGLSLALKRDFRLSNPRIAILTSNTVSTNEEEIIKSVIEELADKKTNAFGPYSTETFLGNCMYEHFDAILPIHYNQGTASFQTLSAEEGLEMKTGLPLVCVQTMQDASYDIAGKNIANESYLRKAIYLAIDTIRNREIYDEPMANPLPKLYHEKRDESEKVRFSIPKKHENSNTGK